MGAGVIRALLEQGAAVVAPVRSNKGKASLEADLEGVATDKLEVPILDVSSEDDGAKLSAYIKEKHGQVDYAVSSIGSIWMGGPLLDLPRQEVERVLAGMALSHLVFAKAVLPLLKDDRASGYIIMTGGAGTRILHTSMSMMTVSVACLFGISLALRAETESRAYRVNEVRLFSRVVRPKDVDKENETKAMGTAYPNTVLTDRLLEVLTATDKKGQVVELKAEDLEQ